MSIFLSTRLTASNTDILNGTRLQSAPRNGSLMIRLIADLADATNNFTCSLQLPNGETPWEDVLVPGANPSLAGVVDERQLLQGTFPVAQGGHVVLSVTETGAAILTYQIIFR